MLCVRGYHHHLAVNMWRTRRVTDVFPVALGRIGWDMTLDDGTTVFADSNTCLARD